MSFSVIVNNIGIFDNIRKLLPRRKTKRKFLEKNRRFVESGIVKTCDEIDLSMTFSVALSGFSEGVLGSFELLKH